MMSVSGLTDRQMANVAAVGVSAFIVDFLIIAIIYYSWDYYTSTRKRRSN